MRTLSYIYIGIAALSLTSGQANAAFIFSNCTGPTVNLTANAPSASGNITCNQFNPTLGTLTRYSIAGIDGPGGPTFTGTFNVFNNTGAALTSQTGGPVMSITYDAFPGQTAFTGVSPVYSTGTVNIPDGATQPLNGLMVMPMIRSSTTDLSPYVGTGTFTVPFSVSYTSIYSGLGQLTGFDLNAYTGITIVYEFNEAVNNGVPEPGSAALLTVGIASGLAIAARKRRR